MSRIRTKAYPTRLQARRWPRIPRYAATLFRPLRIGGRDWAAKVLLSLEPQQPDTRPQRLLLNRPPFQHVPRRRILSMFQLRRLRNRATRTSKFESPSCPFNPKSSARPIRHFRQQFRQSGIPPARSHPSASFRLTAPEVFLNAEQRPQPIHPIGSVSCPKSKALRMAKRRRTRRIRTW